MSDIGERLKNIRRLRMWTQARLAREAGVSPTTISGIETGKIGRRRNRLRPALGGRGFRNPARRDTVGPPRPDLRIGRGGSPRVGPRRPPRPYSSDLVEGLFSEGRRYGVLGRSGLRFG